MGIHGLFAQIGPGQRISLAKLSSDHYIKHDRPLRLAIDISIWLFQIQSGKGGSNPALRTFYYRLLRLLSLNIWPLFVFDGPNKPLFKRNKKVGGPGVRVATVPEFLAKQLLKQFGFPWHVAPGEAEAECALLQCEGIVDAVLSEDVDTLMFGSGLTLRNWTSENSTKTPTHVNVYSATETKEKSGMDREGMILVALMSGGDYLPEGIPGCGPKLACDAARAGFGHKLCALSKRDKPGIEAWKASLQHQIRTNEAKHFSRKNTNFTIPADFPNLEVLGYYTHPCVSTPEKLLRLRQELRWDQNIDFAALRTFTADAFDWRCLGGAKKFIKNLAPAMLIRELRLEGTKAEHLEHALREEHENRFVTAIHGKRNHSTTDGELEYRVTYIPANFVAIDLSIEDEDDQFIPAGGGDESDAESELPGGTQDAGLTSEVPLSPSKKRNFRPFDPSQPEKLWILKTFLQVGCPLTVEDFEAPSKDPTEFLKAHHKARQAAKRSGTARATKPKQSRKQVDNTMPDNSILSYAKVTKPGVASTEAGAMQHLTTSQTNSRCSAELETRNTAASGKERPQKATFQLPSTQIPEALRTIEAPNLRSVDVLDLTIPSRRVGESSIGVTSTTGRVSHHLVPRHGDLTELSRTNTAQRTPRKSKKRPSPELSTTPATQRFITTYYSPSPRRTTTRDDVIDLVSSSPAPQALGARPVTPSPPNTRFNFVRETSDTAVEPPAVYALPDTVTKRRRKEPLKRAQTAPTLGFDDEDLPDLSLPRPGGNNQLRDLGIADQAQEARAPASHVAAKSLDQSNSTASSQHAVALPLRQSPEHPKPAPKKTQSSVRRSPRQLITKKRIELRESLEGTWKEVDAEAVDLSGDGSGWKKSKGRAEIVGSNTTRGWRKSGMEVLDLTGA